MIYLKCWCKNRQTVTKLYHLLVSLFPIKTRYNHSDKWTWQGLLPPPSLICLMTQSIFILLNYHNAKPKQSEQVNERCRCKMNFQKNHEFKKSARPFTRRHDGKTYCWFAIETAGWNPSKAEQSNFTVFHKICSKQIIRYHADLREELLIEPLFILSCFFY